MRNGHGHRRLLAIAHICNFKHSPRETYTSCVYQNTHPTEGSADFLHPSSAIIHIPDVAPNKQKSGVFRFGVSLQQGKGFLAECPSKNSNIVPARCECIS